MNLIAPADERIDALHAAHDAARSLVPDGVGLVGYGFAELLDGDGKTKLLVPFHNLITDAGDLYYAGKMIVGIAPASPSAPTAANGMKLGTGSTAVAKSGAGGALVTYLTASNVAFDSSYPQTANLGAGLGVNAVYKTTWAAGVATNSAITEVAIVNDQATNATSTAANTYSRALITSVNKTASDSLAITWNHKALGA
ncbi:MAG: hypothetical protein ABW046_20575 [Actinoplanes sp.]